MKKFTLLLAALVLGFGLKAQCPHTEAIDFNTTDCHGTPVHLFDILDNGQCVLIDFFYTTCGPCQQATPKVAEAYTRLGCNMHDVFFIEVTPYDNNTSCQNWCQNYGIEYPTIGTDGGGSSICSQYGISAYPTVILITPNHQIVIQDLWPITNSQTIVDQLAPYGIQEHDCDAPQGCDAPTDLAAIALEGNVNLSWVASETALSYNIYRDGELLGNTEEINFVDENVEIMVPYVYTVTSVCGDDLESDPSNEATATLYEAALTFSVDTLDFEYSSHVTIYNYTAEPEVTITKLTSDFSEPLFLFTIGDLTVMDGEETSVTIAQGDAIDVVVEFNIVEKRYVEYTSVLVSNSLADVSFMTVWDNPLGAQEIAGNTVALYPNPANDYVTLSGENIENVTVFNALGQKVDEFVVNGSEVKIATTNYDNGIYFVKVNGTETVRFVVTH